MGPTISIHFSIISYLVCRDFSPLRYQDLFPMQGFHNKMVYKYHINDVVIIVLTYCHNCKHFIIIFEFSLTTQTVECVKFHDPKTEASFNIVQGVS